jgi:hypothetical protein
MLVTKGMKPMVTLFSDTQGAFCWFTLGKMVERAGQICSLLRCYLSSGGHAFHQAVNLHANMKVGQQQMINYSTAIPQ